MRFCFNKEREREREREDLDCWGSHGRAPVCVFAGGLKVARLCACLCWGSQGRAPVCVSHFAGGLKVAGFRGPGFRRTRMMERSVAWGND